MFDRLLIGTALSAAMLWASAGAACTPPPREVPIPREAGEGDTAYQARTARLRAEALAAAQASYEAWALNRETSLLSSATVTRVAVVDVAEISAPEGPPSMTNDFVFSVALPERGMARGEQFTLTEPRFASMPCVPVANYPAGSRYVLFASDGPISTRSTIFLLIPVAEVRSERGQALLRAAERAGQ